MLQTGEYVRCSTAGEHYQAFVPASLPPDPPLDLTHQDYDLIERANRALGRLDGVTTLLPDPSLFTYFYVRKEAILSSQIEGTQSSFSDLLMHEYENLPVPRDDVTEVSNYAQAMQHGLERLRKDDFPVSLRLLRDIHRILMSSGRGGRMSPGEFRRTQNWVGGSRPGNAQFVPPPPDRMMKCLADLELFLNDRPHRTPVLMKAALSHVQFETVHPFLGGNGRLGRLLITLLLCSEDAIQQPLLYLSLYFKQHRQAYYDHLQRVRTEGDWLGWLRFSLNGVYDTSQQAVKTAGTILQRFQKDTGRIDTLGRRAANVHRVHQLYQRLVVASVPTITKRLKISPPTARAAVGALQALRILEETTGKQRDRVYVYKPYLRILDEGTEPIE